MPQDLIEPVPHDRIYSIYADRYDLLRSRMDYEGNLLREINKVADITGRTIVEMAAGTGKITALLAPLAKQIFAFDLSAPMAVFAAQKLAGLNFNNLSVAVADNRCIPVADGIADLVIEGWSLGYIAAAAGDNWQKEIDKVITEMDRLLTSGGMAIVVGTLGTGAHRPSPPNKVLATLYEYLEKEKGFNVTPWFKTDYRFDSIAEAQQLITFFWSKRFGDYISENAMQIVPECTAIWYRKKI